MIPTTFQAITQWILQQGYTVMFILMLIEGPVVTAAGAFAAALSYFHLWIVFLLSILGNLIPDVIYYAMGYWGRQSFIDRYGHYFGLTKQRVAAAERLANKHTAKSLVAIKMIPFLATPGLIVVGASKMDIRKYIWWSLVITVPSSLIYLLIGYYFGAAYNTIDHYLHLGYYLIGAAVAALIFVIYLQRKFAEDFARKFGGE
ncbi:MAG TPA: DedA family protein [Candidatus Paceibacterota bacterium]|nr:DedA family protein [Candidatus Paceibacterota bacterium]